MVVGSRQRFSTMDGDINLRTNDASLCRVQNNKCLRVQVDENLTWKRHSEHIIKKVVCNISILRGASAI